MRRLTAIALLLVTSAGLLGCPTKDEPRSGSVYSDPAAARARGAEATKELERNVQK